ncbi:MAG: insulinase family protein [Chitinophagaceae bacterium]|nr:insulinase family protein [Chitinophagaceae bacterium]
MKHIQAFKQYFSLFLLMIISLFSFSQTKAPYEMNISGVKVIVQPSNNEIVEIQTIIKGGVQNYPLNKAGIESLAMSALSECGTIKDDKNSWKNKLEKVSAQVYGFTGMDYATVTMNCINSDFNTVWPLYVDALVTPRFDAREFERIKQDAINNLKAQASQPDYAINKLAKQTAFSGHDYAKSPEGTEEIVGKLTPVETKAYYTSILTRSRLLIVVVGEIDKAILEQKITSMLAAIPGGRPFILRKEMYNPKQNTFKSEKKELATNYIQAVAGGPNPGSADFDAYKLAMNIFYDRNFLEVRSNNGLSYAPYSYFNGGTTSSSGIGVSTTEPDRYIAVVKTLISKTKKDGFTQSEVKDWKTTYITDFYYKQETNSAQAGAFANNEILHNNWRRSLTLKDDIKKVNVADVNKAFNKYMTNLTWVYQGDPSKVDPTLYTSDTREKLPPSKMVKTKIN